MKCKTKRVEIFCSGLGHNIKENVKVTLVNQIVLS
jgi:hypothetical protein